MHEEVLIIRNAIHLECFQLEVFLDMDFDLPLDFNNDYTDYCLLKAWVTYANSD